MTRPSRRRSLRLASRALLAVGLALLAVAGAIAYHGGRFEGAVFSAGNPVPRLAWGMAALAASYLLGDLARFGRVRFGPAAGRFALVAASLALSLLAVEWAFRVHLQRSQGFGSIETLRRHEAGEIVTPRSTHPVAFLVTLSENRRLIYELRPNMDKQFGPVRVLSSSHGLRSRREHAIEKPPGTLRILGIGDSGMFGWDVPQDETYLAGLERRLEAGAAGERRAPYEVLNAGVPGYNTQQQVEWLASRGLAFDPDVVVVGWTNNDFDAPFFLHRPVDYMSREGSLLYRFLFDRRAFHEDAKPVVDLYTGFARDEIHPDVLAGMGPEGVERALRRLAALAEREGFSVLVFGPLPASVVEWSEQLGFAVYDTLTEIPPDAHPPEHGVHEMHPSPAGHAVLAEHLHRALVRSGLLRADGKERVAEDAAA